MSKKKNKKDNKKKDVKSVNKNVRSSTRKLNPILKAIVGKKVEKQKNNTNKKPIKIWSRKSTIIPDFVGFSFLIYNGKKFIPITVSEDMVGHKFGEFSPTRQFYGHTPADKKIKAEADTKVGKK